jgi:hypothetical protein
VNAWKSLTRYSDLMSDNLDSDKLNKKELMLRVEENPNRPR